MAMIDPEGLFSGDRLAACSDLAQLYWPRLFLASNGFARLELSYRSIISKIFVNFEKPPESSVLWDVFREYERNYLAILYEVNGAWWCEFATSEKYLPRHKTRRDHASPAPPLEIREMWQKGYISWKSSKSFSNQYFHKSSENFCWRGEERRGVGVGEEKKEQLPELPLSSATPTSESPKEAPDLPLLDPVPPEPRVRPEEYANVWNRHRGKLPKVEEFSESRRKKVLTRIKQGITLERFQEAIENCVVKPFLHGDNDSGWVATFDWLIENDKNIEKAITQPYGLNRKEKHAQVPLTKTERNMAVLAEALGRGKSKNPADETGDLPPRGVGPDESRTLHASVTPIRRPASGTGGSGDAGGKQAGRGTNGSTIPW